VPLLGSWVEEELVPDGYGPDAVLRKGEEGRGEGNGERRERGKKGERGKGRGKVERETRERGGVAKFKNYR
jgi:hypothetical protein